MPRRVEAGVWRASEEVEESDIVSDQFEQIIFLIRCPYAAMPDHEEEQAVDIFLALSDSAKGLNWRKQ